MASGRSSGNTVKRRPVARQASLFPTTFGAAPGNSIGQHARIVRANEVWPLKTAFNVFPPHDVSPLMTAASVYQIRIQYNFPEQPENA